MAVSNLAVISNVTLTCHARVHFALIDLSGVSRRKYGGVGMMLEMPTTSISVVPAPRLKLALPEGVENRTWDDAREALKRLSKEVGDICLSFRVMQHIEEHVGLGSKTALLLGLLATARQALSLDLSDDELKRLSGRGGTSGIGVHGFFVGGCIVDAGQPRDATGAAFLPSSAGVPPGISMLSKRCEIPTRWKIHIVIPPGIRHSPEDERALFREQTPIEEREALEALALVHHGVIPAILDADLAALADSLTELHKTGFKRRELDCQTAVVRDLYGFLREHRFGAVGMSSLGPALYIISDSPDTGNSLRSIASDVEGCVYIESAGYNRGFGSR